MALTGTTLAGAITAAATQIKLTSGTGVTKGMIGQVDSEWILFEDVSQSPWFTVVRGRMGSAAVAHNTLAAVNFGVPTDFVQSTWGLFSPPVMPQVEYGAAGAITVPSVDTYITLKSGASSAMTLNDPNKDCQALVIIQAADAKAYTVDNGSTNNTSGSGFNAGGTASDVGTFGGAIGDGMVIKAVNGKWLVITKTNVTLA